MKIDRIFNDTSYISLQGPNWQPTILDSRMKGKDLNYSIESLLFDGPDGNKLHGWMMHPHEVTEEVTILFLHGNGGSVSDTYLAMDPFVTQGFRAFLFDYRGFGRSTGGPDRFSLQRDALAALFYLRSRKEVQQGPVVIYGQSLGGHTAILLANQADENVIGVIADAAFSSFDDVGARASRLGVLARVLSRNGNPAKRVIRNLDMPVLIIHSTKDPVVPYRMGKRLYENANEPKQLYTTGGCHTCSPRFHADSIAVLINDMLPR